MATTGASVGGVRGGGGGQRWEGMLEGLGLGCRVEEDMSYSRGDIPFTRRRHELGRLRHQPRDLTMRGRRDTGADRGVSHGVDVVIHCAVGKAEKIR